MTSVSGEAWFADPALVRVLALLNGEGGEARVAGGAVRNSLMGLPVADIDIATTLRPEAVVARAKVVGGGVSRRKVVTELRRRGVSAETADQAIDATLTEVDLDEEGAAMQAAEKRVRALRSLEPAVQRQRLYAYLARRGFESDVVRRVIASVMR